MMFTRIVCPISSELVFIASLSRLRTCAFLLPKRSASTDAPPEGLEGLDLGAVTREPQKDEAALRKLRDISGLKPHHWNVVHGTHPHKEKFLPHHYTVQYNRELFAQYGSATNVNPGICWPTKEDLEDRLEWERVTYPHTIMEVVEEESAKNALEERLRWELDERVATNIANMNKFRAELKKKRDSEEEAKQTALAKKQRLIAEVREHFNYSINERDDRFKAELLERARVLKEKERLARRAVKTEKKEEKRAVAAAMARKMLLEESGLPPQQ